MLENSGFYEQMFAYRAPRIHISLARLPRRPAVAILAVAAFWLACAAWPSAQFEKMVSTTFDGWSQKSDGSYELVFGYMNRNASEVEVPLGPANQVEPAPLDHGQPTNFLPGRQR